VSVVPIIGHSCANCGQIVQRNPDAKGIAYATSFELEGGTQPGRVPGIVTLQVGVFRSEGEPMLLCDGCMGAVLKATCESILKDMEDISEQGKESAYRH
jgi:hypothetical protein